MQQIPAGPARALLVPVSLAAALVLAACGGDSPPSVDGPQGVGQAAPLRSATCTDWNRSNAQSKLSTIENLRIIAGGPVTGEGVVSRGVILDDEQAYRLFDSYCSEDVAEDFLLYKLYTHAAAFAGRPPE